MNQPTTLTTPDILIIGCGNLLRGDDGVGPLLIRHLWERELPPGVRLADGGTAGMDVAFKMRGADRVILIDACRTGAAPGTIYRVPGAALEQLPPLTGIHLHAFRWDHALAFARWLLKEEYPTNIQVYLIEIASLAPSENLSQPVAAAMEQVIELLLGELAGAMSEQSAN